MLHVTYEERKKALTDWARPMFVRPLSPFLHILILHLYTFPGRGLSYMTTAKFSDFFYTTPLPPSLCSCADIIYMIYGSPRKRIRGGQWFSQRERRTQQLTSYTDHFAQISTGLGIKAWGLVFLASKVAFSWPSVDRFGKKLLGLMNLAQIKNSQNFY